MFTAYRWSRGLGYGRWRSFWWAATRPRKTDGRLPWPNCTMCGKPGDVVRGLGYAVCQNQDCPDYGIGIHDDYGDGDAV